MPQSILQDPLLLTRLKWSEIVDVLCLEVLGETRRDPLSMRGLLDIDAIDSGVFRTYFRFEKDDVPRLQRALCIPDKVTTPQRVSVPGDEALCITLRRLAYPNRLRDLEHLFARHSSTISSLTNEVLRHIEDNFFHLLDDVNNHTWLNLDTLEEFSKAVPAKGAPLTNCWAFIDGTAQPICRPTRNQKVYFSGHKRVHALKYEAIMCPNGIICQLDGSYPGSKHDSGNFGNSAAYTKLQNLVQGHDCCIYGDPAYPLRPLLLKPYGGALLTPEQLAFNKAMSSEVTVTMASCSGTTTDLSLKSVLKARTDQDMNRIEKRLSTFEGWLFQGEECACNPQRMAEAGFYHARTENEPDLARCYVCYKEMIDWDSNDEPLKEHSRSRDCAFVLLRKRWDELTLKDFLGLEAARAKNRAWKLAKLYSDNLDDAMRKVHLEMENVGRRKR
nr:uncharacterized protein LOC119162191 [Rhipicephalus microplus]